MRKQFFLPLISALFLTIFSVTALAEIVNLNKADATAFQQHLSGIGPVKAAAIVSYRKKNGAFKSISDLKNVPGIGDALIATNKKSLSLSKGVVKGDPKALKKTKAKKATATKTKTVKKEAAKKTKTAKKEADKKTKSAKKKASSKAKDKVASSKKKAKKTNN